MRAPFRLHLRHRDRPHDLEALQLLLGSDDALDNVVLPPTVQPVHDGIVDSDCLLQAFRGLWVMANDLQPPAAQLLARPQRLLAFGAVDATADASSPSARKVSVIAKLDATATVRSGPIRWTTFAVNPLIAPS